MAKVNCPSYSTVPAFSYPFAYRQRFVVPAASTSIGIFAPWNDCLGVISSQDIYPPTAATVPALQAALSGFGMVDPFLTSLLTPSSTSVQGTEVPRVRFTKFCVELSNITTLLQLAGETMIYRYTLGSVPNIALSGGGPNYYQIYNNLSEMPEVTVHPGNDFAKPQCIEAIMADRSALEFTKVALGTTPWVQAYVATAGVDSLGLGSTVAWTPIVVYIGTGAVAGTSTIADQAWQVTVRGEVQVSGVIDSFLARLSVPLPIPRPSDESNWWRYMRTIAQKQLYPVPTTQNSRSTAGVLGLVQKRKPKNNNKGSKPKASTSSFMAPKPRIYNVNVPSVKKTKTLKVLRDAFENREALMDLFSVFSNALSSSGPRLSIKQGELR